MSNQKTGWAVQIIRSDLSTFLACGGPGNMTPVWIKKNKSWAELYKDELEGHGFKVKLVKVVYTDPRVIS